MKQLKTCGVCGKKFMTVWLGWLCFCSKECREKGAGMDDGRFKCTKQRQ